MIKPANNSVAVRLAPALLRTFTTKASKYGGRSEVMRELIRAFCENRLTIQQPTTEGTLYEPR
jgi:metal-responsive CopG/Arc/MetJ family transcriptional regulator